MTGSFGPEGGVHFIRHAPTEYNLAGQFMGSLDPPIILQDRLPRCWTPTPTVGYVSPMRRARETIDAIYPGLNYHVDARLRERALGEWEGKTLQEVREGWPQAFLECNGLDPRFSPPEGEDLHPFRMRIRSFLADLQEGGDRPAVVVTHNGCIRMVKAILGHIRLDDFFLRTEDLSQPLYVSWADLRRTSLPESV